MNADREIKAEPPDQFLKKQRHTKKFSKKQNSGSPELKGNGGGWALKIVLQSFNEAGGQ
jgi:hypothetical protein